ncbi:MAG: phenylalanine--tRNA ligase subunit beta [Flavobacteriales bacterium]
MKIAYNWLSNFIKTDLELERVGEILTDIGLEVEGIEKTSGIDTDFNKVFIGEVTSCNQHPDADKLKVCTVNIGTEDDLNIVCGAPNVDFGQKIIVATHGAVLNPNGAEKPLKIKKGKIRGQVSQGMICSEEELGLPVTNTDGILVLSPDAIPGECPLTALANNEDYCIEIGLTPNRADAMSHYGVARDLKAYCDYHNVPYTWNELAIEKVENNLPEFTTKIESDASFRYSGVTVDGVTVAPSPEWLQDALRSVGLEPINNIVDVSNYVMHHMGQPLHMFDLEKIEGETIVVRKAKNGEKITTLDEKEVELIDEDLLICDATKPLCIAGVMGGLNSGVSNSTTSIFIESAYFEPVSVRKTAKRHTFHTDASFRFERGIDINAINEGLFLAVKLIKEICPEAKVTSKPTDKYTQKINDFSFEFSQDKCRKLIGKDISNNDIQKALQVLNISFEEKENNILNLSVPSFRNDVTRDVDIVEEVLRLIGYNSVEIPTRFKASLEIYDGVNELEVYNKVADTLVANGFNEAMNNSLTKSDYLDLFEEFKSESAVEILNPLSKDLSFMRQSLLPGLLENTAYNFNRQNKSVRFFEFGKVYNSFNNEYHEEKKLSLLISGEYKSNSWNEDKEVSNFYHLKSAIERVLEKLGLLSRTKQKDVDFSGFLDGVSYKVKKQEIARIGIVSPKVNKATGLKKGECFYAELHWDTIISLLSQTITFNSIPKFPTVSRDLALVMDKSVSFADIQSIAFESDKKILKNVDIFDVYTGDKILESQKSYAISFTFQDPNKTLVDKQVDQSILKIFNNLKKRLGLELRDGELKA